MRARFYRVWSSRSFTRSLSIVAVAVVAFAALELLLVQPALALKCCACTSSVVGSNPGSCTTGNTNNCICDPSSACSITKFSTVSQRTEKFLFTPKVNLLPISCTDTSANTTLGNLKSEITCTGISESTFLEPSSLQRIGLTSCTVSDHQSGCVTGNETGCQAVCAIDLTYLQAPQGNQPGLSTCVNNPGDTSTRTYSASCSDALTGKLEVSGTIKCPASLNNNVLPTFCEGNQACELKLGIAGLNVGQCDDQDFFAPNGQVLSFSRTVSGLDCSTETQVLAQSVLTTDFCSGGAFDGSAAVCLTGQNQNLVGGGTATAAVPFDVTFTPKSLNLNCGTNNNDTWHFTITGNENLLVANIDPASLAVEGVHQVVNCSKNLVANTMSCDINACDPNSNNDVGSIACANRNANGTVDLTVTGTLLPPLSGTAIIGVDANHKSGGNCTLPG